MQSSAVPLIALVWKHNKQLYLNRKSMNEIFYNSKSLTPHPHECLWCHWEVSFVSNVFTLVNLWINGDMPDFYPCFLLTPLEHVRSQDVLAMTHHWRKSWLVWCSTDTGAWSLLLARFHGTPFGASSSHPPCNCYVHTCSTSPYSPEPPSSSPSFPQAWKQKVRCK